MNKIGDTLVHTAANEEVVRAFADSGVDFIVIGGLAVAWYCAERQADDMDLLIDPTPENSARIFHALSDLHFTGFASNYFTKLGLQVPLKQFHYAELLTPTKNGPQYSEIANDAVDAKLFNISVRLASMTSLIRLKELAIAAGEPQRDKHLHDIECLKKRIEILRKAQ